jgi:hypothetical protein
MTQIRSQSCLACPYRQDAPSGLWAEEEYDKLTEYDNPTSEQPFAAFFCHATPEVLCHGWAVCHSNRGHEFELLALRLWEPEGGLPEADAKLFACGREAAEHGKRDLSHPSPEARATAQRLMRKYERLRGGATKRQA